MFDDVGPADLAGLLSAFVYESRASGPLLEEWYPDADLARRAADLASLAVAVAADERALGLSPTRVPDPSFFRLAHAWSSGRELDRILGDDLPGGDFVRTIKQLLDLLRQVGDLGAPCSVAAAGAVADMHRGVVAVSGGAREED